ncbi:MAG: molecular chaperone HtpG [Sandaracinaceae bacterium]
MTAEPVTHKFEAEVEQVLRLVIESLYSNREVFLRELLSNAADALDKLRFDAVSHPEHMPEDGLKIRIVPDRDAGTLTIWDNGIGMSEAELKDNLGTIARSGTRELANKLREAKEAGDLSLIGQFGVGFYSAFLVADRVDVVSRAAGSDAAFKWSSDAKHSFTIEPAERDVAGTSVVLHLAAEHEATYLDAATLRTLVSRYSDYLSFPIELRTSKKEGDGYVEGFEKINAGSALWQRPKSEIDDEKAAELYRHLAHDFEKPRCWRHFKIEGTQEFAGMVFVPRRAPMTIWMPDETHGVRLYVKRVFIMDEAQEILPRWLRFVRGVVDSDDLPLNVSRELLQDSKIVRVIRNTVQKQSIEMLKELSENDPKEYAELWTTFGSVIKEGLHQDPSLKDSLAPLFRFSSSRGTGLRSLSEAKEAMKEGQKELYYVVAESLAQAQASPHIEAIKQKGYEVLYYTDPVDPFMAEVLTDFDGVPLVDASAAKLTDDAGTEAASEEREAELAELRERFRIRLQDHVSEVRTSRRLTDSAVCLVVPEGGVQPHIERLLRSAQRDVPVQKRILELNPDHPVIENLRALLSDPDKQLHVDDWIQLLYETARVSEGSPLEDPAAFNRRVTELLTGASKHARGAADG